jgi:hypothetical protein
MANTDDMTAPRLAMRRRRPASDLPVLSMPTLPFWWAQGGSRLQNVKPGRALLRGGGLEGRGCSGPATWRDRRTPNAEIGSIWRQRPEGASSASRTGGIRLSPEWPTYPGRNALAPAAISVSFSTGAR